VETKQDAKGSFALALGLAPVASVGSAPSVSVGGALSIDARLGALLAGVEGRADLPASAAVGALGRVESSLVAGSLFAGARQGPIFFGVVGSVGRLVATSTDVAVSRDKEALYLGAGVRVGVGIPLAERIEARLRADVLATLHRHVLEISGQPAHELPFASANLSAGLAVRFW
jgi:hypothetical protein